MKHKYLVLGVLVLGVAALFLMRQTESVQGVASASAHLNQEPVTSSSQQILDQPSRVTINVGQAVYRLTSHPLGDFDQIYVSPKSHIQIRVEFPDATSGDSVFVEAKDGGLLDNQSASKTTTLDERKEVAFGYITTSEEGTFRVLVRTGTKERELNFRGECLGRLI